MRDMFFLTRAFGHVSLISPTTPCSLWSSKRRYLPKNKGREKTGYSVDFRPQRNEDLHDLTIFENAKLQNFKQRWKEMLYNGLQNFAIVI